MTKVSGCDIQTASWRSWYDGVTTASSTEFDIDHMVPLAASSTERSLTVIRPSGCRRSISAATSRYVQHWVAVKIRWDLTVDRTKKRALLSLAKGCADTRTVVAPAVITVGGSGSGGGGGGADDGADDGLDPRFDYCYQARADGDGPYYRGSDPEYDWYTDADSDGVVCE